MLVSAFVVPHKSQPACVLGIVRDHGRSLADVGELRQGTVLQLHALRVVQGLHHVPSVQALRCHNRYASHEPFWGPLVPLDYDPVEDSEGILHTFTSGKFGRIRIIVATFVLISERERETADLRTSCNTCTCPNSDIG